jgi:hypothetical protein
VQIADICIFSYISPPYPQTSGGKGLEEAVQVGDCADDEQQNALRIMAEFPMAQGSLRRHGGAQSEDLLTLSCAVECICPYWFC